MDRGFWHTKSRQDHKTPDSKYQFLNVLLPTLLIKDEELCAAALGQEILKENHPFLVPSCFCGYEKPLLSLPFLRSHPLPQEV